MERKPETLRLLLLGMHRLGRRILDERRDAPEVAFLPLGETAVADADDDVRYRGYRVAELLERATYPEVAFLLLEGDLPNAEFLADFQSLLIELAEIPLPVARLRNELPLHVGDGEALRAMLTTLAVFDPELDDDATACGIGKATRLLATAPFLLGPRRRILEGMEPERPAEHLSFAATVLQQMTGAEPTPAAERAVDALLVTLAEESRDPATLAARVTASNGGDVYAAVTAAVCACDNRVGNEICRRILDTLDSTVIKGKPTAVVDRDRPPTGFAIVESPDPRVGVLSEIATELAAETGATAREEAARDIELAAAEQWDAAPLLSWPIARLLDLLGLDSDAFSPLLTIARLAGWTAHALEESGMRRRLSGRSLYVGRKTRSLLPIDDR